MLKKFNTLRVKFPVIAFIAGFVLMLVMLPACYMRFYQNMIDTYEDLSDEVLGLASDDIIIDHIPDYLYGKYSWQEYNRTLKKLNKYIEYCDEIYYLYAYKIPEEGTVATVIFDAYNEHDVETLGDDYELEYDIVENLDKLRAGEQIDPLIDNTEWGYLMTCSKPLIDSKGVCQGYIFVDFNLTELRRTNIIFILKLFALVFALMFIVLLLGMKAIDVRITTPIEKMHLCLSSFQFSSDKDRQENIERLKSLDIHTNPEIQSLYDALVASTQDSYTYSHKYQVATEELGEAREMALSDALTGFGNKTAYDERVQDLQKRIDEGVGLELGVIMADINNLKYINDNFGHNRGDEYIIGCCKAMEDICKHSAKYRIGGDEFVILLENEDYKDRKNIFDKLEDAYKSAYQDESRDQWQRFSVSVGMAEYSAESDITEVIKRADSAMYSAKAEFKKKYGSYR